MKNAKDFLALFIIGIGIVATSVALFHEGFFRTSDDITTVRILAMLHEFDAINYAQNVPIRISSFLSYGRSNMLFTFYSPLVYYVGAFLMKFGGLSHIVATKAVYFLPFLIGPLLFYLAVRIKTKPIVALIGTISYVFFPYIGYDIYVKGGAGEALAMSFIPGTFMGILLIEKKRAIGLAITSVFIALMIITHHLTALIALTVLILYGLVFVRKNLHLWLSIVFGLGISAFYWLPVLYYMKLVRLTYLEMNTTALLSKFISLQELFGIDLIERTGERYSGIITWIILFLIGILIIKKAYFSTSKQFLRLGFWLSVSVISIFLMTEFSKTVWLATLSITGILQFPSRLFIVLSISYPLAVTFWVHCIKSTKLIVAIFLSLLVLSFSFMSFFRPSEYHTFYEYRQEGLCGSTTWEDEFMPVWVKECVGSEAKSVIEIQPPSPIHLKEVSDLRIVSEINPSTQSKLVVNKYYFPGWKVFINNQEQSISPTASISGQIELRVPAGRGTVLVEYFKTPIMTISDFISILTLLVFIVYGGIQQRDAILKLADIRILKSLRSSPSLHQNYKKKNEERNNQGKVSRKKR